MNLLLLICERFCLYFRRNKRGQLVAKGGPQNVCQSGATPPKTGAEYNGSSSGAINIDNVVMEIVNNSELIGKYDSLVCHNFRSGKYVFVFCTSVYYITN